MRIDFPESYCSFHRLAPLVPNLDAGLTVLSMEACPYLHCQCLLSGATWRSEMLSNPDTVCLEANFYRSTNLWNVFPSSSCLHESISSLCWFSTCTQERLKAGLIDSNPTGGMSEVCSCSRRSKALKKGWWTKAQTGVGQRYLLKCVPSIWMSMVLLFFSI